MLWRMWQMGVNKKADVGATAHNKIIKDNKVLYVHQAPSGAL